MVLWAIVLAAVVVSALQSASYSQAVAGREALARVRAYWAARGGVEATIARLEFNTTSGSGTGIPPTVAKLRAMREAAARPIAVASGISSSNIGNYESLVDEILVASSVETAPYSGVFEMAALARTIEAAHGLD